MTRSYAAIFLIIISCIKSTSGLYEDQINKYDWKKEYIGRPTDIVYDNTMSISKNFYVITEKHVLASLASKNGQLNWRQVSDEKLVKVMKYGSDILTISESGVMRIWDPATGILKWDLNFGSFAGEDIGFHFVAATVVELDYAESDIIVVSTSDGVYAVNAGPARSGSKPKPKVLYQKYSNSIQGLGKLFVNAESNQICVLDIVKDSSITVRFFNAKSLNQMNENVIPTSWLDNIDAVVVTEANCLVYVCVDMEMLYIIDLFQGSQTSHHSFSSLGITSNIKSLQTLEESELSNIGTDFFSISQNGDVMHFKIENKREIKVMNKNSGSSDALVSVLKVGNEQHYFVSRISNSNLEVDAFSLRSSDRNDNLKIDFKLPSNVGAINKVFINMFLKKTSPMGYRVVAITEDDCMMVVSLPTRLSWRRDESLSDVLAAEILDLPLSDMEAGIEIEFEEVGKLSVFQMFVNRIKVQTQQIKSFARHLTKGIKEGTLFEKKTKDPLVQDESLTRDPFSLHKMLVLVTRCGKVFGMDSLSGEVIWSFYLPEMESKKVKLYVQRTTAHFPNPSSAVIVATDENKSAVAIIFNPITGEITMEQKHFAGIIQASLLPFTDSTHVRPLILLSNDMNVHLVPDSPEIRKRLSEMRDFIYIINADTEKGKINGYWMREGQKMLETFLLNIPSGQQILNIKGKDFSEKIDSIGRPLADRSVIYKYLNPNLILMITGSKVQSEQSSLTMYLVDGVSGEIVYYATHKKASGPVHAVHSENWIIYSYWNTKLRRTEIASYELYEGKEQRNSTKFSSYDDYPGVPQVISQAYILHGTVTAMGVSRTEKGLTSRQLLMALGRGSVVGMPRRFFDPRRPIRPRITDREEGLIPYMPEIQITPLALITYNKTIPAISNIYTCPSALESTSIVLVTGLDLFFTRTHPSNMFDVLKEDFEYLLIIAVLFGMFLAMVITRKLAQNKKLKKSWR